MTAVAIRESTKRYNHEKRRAGYKRIQVWTLDSTNSKIQERIAIATKQINQEHDQLVSELESNIHDLLQDSPL